MPGGDNYDLIMRWRVKLLLMRLRDEVDDGYGFDYESAMNELRDMPSEHVERKIGRWIHDGCKYEGGTDWMHCSECGYMTVWGYVSRTPYCGWCGAYMGGEQDGSD